MWQALLFSDLHYAEDVALCDHSLDSLHASLLRLQAEGSRFGLNINWAKTKVQNVGYGLPATSLQVGPETVEAVSDFTYLGCSFQSDAPLTLKS